MALAGSEKNIFVASLASNTEMDNIQEEVCLPEESAELPDLEYVIDILAAGHTITVEFLAHLSKTKHWSAEELQSELESKGFQLKYRGRGDKLINIQEE